MKRTLVATAVLLQALYTSTSYAIQVNIDEFGIAKNGSQFFLDSFLDGSEPPSTPTSFSYGVLGSFGTNAESGGKLLLDTAIGAFTGNAIEEARQAVVATLLTDISADMTPGLKSDDALTVGGLFDLVIPTGPLFSGYGVRFSDTTAGGTHQLLQMFVRYDPVTGQPEIRYILQDFDANTITLLGSILLNPPSGADQIFLRIDKPQAATNEFFGSYQFYDNGSPLALNTFGTPGSAFNGENFVRAQFFASHAVPEPTSLLLFGSGLLLLAKRIRKRSR
jgi:hypothetical protein